MLRFSVTWLLSNYSVIFENPVRSVWTVADDLYVYNKTVSLAYVLRMSSFQYVQRSGSLEEEKKTAAFLQKLSTEALCYLVQDARGKSSEECEV